MNKITLKLLSLIALCFSFTMSYGQDYSKKVKPSRADFDNMSSIDVPVTAQVFNIDIPALQNKLSTAVPRNSANNNSNLILDLPNLTGGKTSYFVEEASVMEPALQAQYPEIRAYVGHGPKGEYLRFTVTPYNGLNGIILSPNRSESVVIQNVKGSGVNKTAFFSRLERKTSPVFSCDTAEEESLMNKSNSSTESFAADDSTLRTFRTAISTTGEYSAFHGGSTASVSAAIATSLARINSVYEIDFATTMVLVANNNTVIFLNAGTDPYNFVSANNNNYNAGLQSQLTSNIGEANYDVGHLYAGVSNSGNAGCIGCICVNGQKGSGYTTSTNPVGDRWDIDYVAHEYGHQYGGNHTFTHRVEGGIAQMEPGSGTTIMGYAGITGATDVQATSDPYFHGVSIQQITAHVKSRTCDTESNTGNNIPVVNAGSNITLPIGTPFTLSGSATDGDAGDVLSYCWEQYDENNAANAYPSPTNANSNEPLFRSYSPSMNGQRTFPRMADLAANGVNGNNWEKVPTVARVADFRLTVRDNKSGGAGNSFDNMRITWDATKGPLEVTSQSVDGVSWTPGATETITWNTNSTNTMAGASNVDILLSIDGGLTYPTTLASNVLNDGSQTITVPNVTEQNCRVMVKPTGAPFFNINAKNFAINLTVTNDCTDTITGNYTFSIPDGGTSYAGLGLTTTSTKVLGGNVTLKVGLNITHPNVADLQFALQPPSGSPLLVMWSLGTCGTNDNINIEFVDGGGALTCASPTTGTANPQNPFSTFDGQTVTGQWVLGVVDAAGNGATGTVNSMTLTFCEKSTAVILGTEDFENENQFSMYPNPSKDLLNIEFDTTNDVGVELLDIRGRSVLSNSYKSTGDKFKQQLNINHISTGIYVVKVTDGSNVIYRKLVKK